MAEARTYDPLPRFVVASARPARLTTADLEHLRLEHRAAFETDDLLRGGQGRAAPGLGSAGFSCCLWLILFGLIALGFAV